MENSLIPKSEHISNDKITLGQFFYEQYIQTCWNKKYLLDEDREFIKWNKLTNTEKDIWNSFSDVIENYLRNKMSNRIVSILLDK